MDITTILLQIELFSKQLETTSLTTIERDLIKSKLLSLYEKVSLSNPVQMPIVPTLEQSTPPALEVPKVELTPMPVEEKTLPKVEEPVAVVEKIVEPVIERVPAPTIVEAPVQTSQKFKRWRYKKQPPSAPYKEVSLIDRLSETDNSLMGKFTTSSKGLNDNVTEGDLKKLIDFNRQFVFIQELFGNDPKAYMEAINRLNTIQTIEEAVKYINQELVPKYNWNKDLQSLKLFDKIIRQKFGI
jgi:hypothetical protein